MLVHVEAVNHLLQLERFMYFLTWTVIVDDKELKRWTVKLSGRVEFFGLDITLLSFFSFAVGAILYFMIYLTH